MSGAREDYRRYRDECATFNIAPASWGAWWERYAVDYE